MALSSAGGNIHKYYTTFKTRTISLIRYETILWILPPADDKAIADLASRYANLIFYSSDIVTRGLLTPRNG